MRCLRDWGSARSSALARPQVAAGRLVAVLADWTQPTLPIHLVYPATRHPSARLRAFADWAIEIFGQAGGGIG
uniref:LysR substrate-binding domain-containing protein n=1 Tax=uncultured Sphingomonas sp. TaxID=158754 RepID=UPI0035CC3816